LLKHSADDLFVEEEQMMPLLPIVRCKNFEEAVQLAKASEHNYKHSAMIHTMNIARMTEMGRLMDTTLVRQKRTLRRWLGYGW
jgi:aldehyde dehydrogenase